MGVLVSVDVGDAEAGGLKTAELGYGFGLDFGFADAAGVEVGGKTSQSWPQGSAIGAEGGDLRGRESRGGVDQQHVAADFEAGVGASKRDGVVEEGGGGHQGGGGERATLVELGDGAVDAGSEAEVVGVDEKGHWKSVAKKRSDGEAVS
jgi:hypothetical protein